LSRHIRGRKVHLLRLVAEAGKLPCVQREAKVTEALDALMASSRVENTINRFNHTTTVVDYLTRCRRRANRDQEPIRSA